MYNMPMITVDNQQQMTIALDLFNIKYHESYQPRVAWYYVHNILTCIVLVKDYNVHVFSDHNVNWYDHFTCDSIRSQWVDNHDVWCNMESLGHNDWTLCGIVTPLIAKFMGPTWDPSGADMTQVGPMLAPWTLLSGSIWHQTSLSVVV